MLSIWSEVELQDLEQFSQKAGALVLDKAQISVECIVYQLKNPLIPIFGALFPISGNRKKKEGRYSQEWSGTGIPAHPWLEIFFVLPQNI